MAPAACPHDAKRRAAYDSRPTTCRAASPARAKKPWPQAGPSASIGGMDENPYASPKSDWDVRGRAPKRRFWSWYVPIHGLVVLISLALVHATASSQFHGLVSLIVLLAVFGGVALTILLTASVSLMGLFDSLFRRTPPIWLALVDCLLTVLHVILLFAITASTGESATAEGPAPCDHGRRNYEKDGPTLQTFPEFTPGSGQAVPGGLAADRLVACRRGGRNHEKDGPHKAPQKRREPEATREILIKTK